MIPCAYSNSPLPLQELVIVVGLALLYLVVLDVVKVQYYKRTDKDASKLLDVVQANFPLHTVRRSIALDLFEYEGSGFKTHYMT